MLSVIGQVPSAADPIFSVADLIISVTEPMLSVTEPMLSVTELVEVTGSEIRTEMSTATGILLTGGLDSSSFSKAQLRFRYSFAPG